MPSLERRREQDLRAGRLESEIRTSELPALAGARTLGFCRRCGKAFEERSKVCPRCDKRDQMGYIEPLSEEAAARMNRRQIERGIR